MEVLHLLNSCRGFPTVWVTCAALRTKPVFIQVLAWGDAGDVAAIRGWSWLWYVVPSLGSSCCSLTTPGHSIICLWMWLVLTPTQAKLSSSQQVWVRAARNAWL